MGISDPRGSTKNYTRAFGELISAEDETYEEKDETPVDVIKDKAKDDLNPVILSKERADLDDDEIEEKPKLCLRENLKN
ncbi:hypothetical protein TNCV_4796441 [Trichonephila clavipes]|uniref:Uncharacterized protein n=1 Tax=Trichonephila clavipes TaxID=2585209 RepID=A0A8X6RUA2_TRICX|nr:hypothetical protein TNCV_4796441 [Trichonephila clavipes]